MIIYVFLKCTSICAQQFVVKGKPIKDYNTPIAQDSILIEVNNLPQMINASFGLTRVCFNIEHTRVSDLKIELLSPDGTAIWLTNRNGKDDGADYVNTCFRSNGFQGYIHKGTAPFVGEYIPDGRMTFINNGQNPNGKWYLLVSDLKAGSIGKVHYVSLDFSENPMPNLDKGGCSVESPELCKVNPNIKDGQLLPDLVMLPSFTKNQIKEYAQNDIFYPGQLRLAATIANIGDGPMEVLGKGEWFNEKGEKVDSLYVDPNGHESRQTLYQRIYRKTPEGKLVVDDIKTGTNYFDNKPGHNHYHVDDWVKFRLVQKKVNKKGKELSRKIIKEGSKVSYCLWDTGICNSADSVCFVDGKFWGNSTLPNYGLGGFNSCKSYSQGISVGGYDTYGMMYEGQFLTLPKGLKNGKYWIEIEIDPSNKYKESNENNNILSLPIWLTKQE
ncbi:MAG: proprotein convertase P-domain-containing protein [Bacteroidia bacterium]|nr:proprotein convertase P-domain-containing protein [Pseudarcicella sp.]MBP6756907.1 proprotein convertase P-domain-containing protein [Bacteroidia bacterium]